MSTARTFPPHDDRVECTFFMDDKGGPPIFLRRGKKARAGKPVLLIHGASASCDTFLSPAGASFFDYLESQGFDVWMLDWSCSFYVADASPELANRTADEVAQKDIPEAIARVREARSDQPLSVLGHCMGGAVLAMAVGADHVKPWRTNANPGSGVDKIVLSTIGLFYEVTWDGWTKVQDRVLERVADANPELRTISPAVTPWPAAFEDTFKLWPKTWGPPWKDEFFHRLAFLYGQPFLVSNLHEKMDEAAVRKQFGAIPFTFYRHGAQNALRGFAAELDAEGKLPADTANEKINEAVAEVYMNLERFDGFDITLLTGADNPLWHRDAIDRMGEWLSRGRRQPLKLVLDDYGHQDLWWGKNSARDVFPRVVKGLGEP